jgi:DNA helicase-2/ATP-dependent DNA helicase PcrA
VEADDNCVTMMTIHAAKGLEFPTVYVVGMEEGIFPGTSAMYDQDELEEERRLCYVAMTRAKEKLTLTNCRQRMLYGRTSTNPASRFLDEIPEDNMHWESKPESRFGGMEHDDTFGGDRYEGGGSTYGGQQQRSARTGSYTTGGGGRNGSVQSYRGSAPAPQRPLASTRRNAPAPSTVMQLEKGDMVEHTAFGKGMVLSVRPMGGDALAEVAFDQVGAKKLMLKSAGSHMKKL